MLYIKTIVLYSCRCCQSKISKSERPQAGSAVILSRWIRSGLSRGIAECISVKKRPDLLTYRVNSCKYDRDCIAHHIAILIPELKDICPGRRTPHLGNRNSRSGRVWQLTTTNGLDSVRSMLISRNIKDSCTQIQALFSFCQIIVELCVR